MDFAKIIARAKAILTTPKTEWPAIAIEPETPKGLYLNYVVVLAALPAVAGFVRSSLYGFGGLAIPIGISFTQMVVSYLLSLALVYIAALIVNALAPSFGGQKDMTQALKTVAYAWTGYWVASIGLILPWIGLPIAIAGLIYTIYLTYLGVPHTMKAPIDRTAGYTAVSVIIGIVIGWILTAIVSGIFLHSVNHAGTLSFTDGEGRQVTVDTGAMAAKLDAMGKRAEEASKAMDEARKSGDVAAQQAAADKMVGATLSGGSKVESLSTEQMKGFLPDSVAGLKRESVSAARNASMGIQVTEAQANYGDGNDHSLELDVSDTGSMKGMMAMASALAPQSETQTDHGYEKTYTEHGRMVQERWDSASKEGEYSVVVGQRFTVKATGHADSIDQLKQAVAAVDLSKLESLKDEGVAKE